MNAPKAPKRICIVGATGLIGTCLIEQAVNRSDYRIVGVARRETKLPEGARMEMLIADPSGWADAIAASNAEVLVCALGNTRRKVDEDETAFRAVNFDLVLSCARYAKEANIGHLIVISSVGANRLGGNFYLQVKGEMEEAVSKVGLRRLDILRPGLLRGPRGETRPAERLAMWLRPVIDLFLHGQYRKYRSIGVPVLGQAIFALAGEKARGRFVHEHDALLYAIRRAGG